MSKKTVRVSIVAEEAREYEECIEVIPTMAEKHCIKASASVQDVHVVLNRYFIDYPQLYANKVYSIEREPQIIRMSNNGNIASKFKWTLPMNSDIIQAIIDPMDGMIEPKSEIKVKVKFAIKLFGKFQFYFRCDFDNIDLPLGFELTGSVFGLDIIYENIPALDELALSRKKNLKKMQKNLSATGKTIQSINMSVNSSSGAAESTVIGTALEMIELNDLSINEPQTFKFKIKNSSGISTTFRLYFDNFDASHLAKPKGSANLGTLGALESSPSNLMDQSFSKNKSMSNKNFSIHSDSVNKTRLIGQTTTMNRKLKLLNDEIEQTHIYYSENGLKATQAKYAQKEAENFLTNNKGLALVCEPTEGNLKANSEVIVTVKIYNELSGVFLDTLNCDIKGLETEKFPVKLFIQGSPLKIPTDQVGLNIQSDPPILDFGGKLKGDKLLERILKLKNIGTQPLHVTLKIFNIDDLDSQRDQFKVSIEERQPGSNNLVQVKWNPIEPDQTNDIPFSLESYQVVVPAKSSLPVKVFYESNTVRAYNSVLTITPQFEQSNTSAKVDLGQLSVLLKSSTLNPQLTLHEQPNLNGEVLFKFDKWSVGRAPKQTQNILLLNKLPCHLYFKCLIDGPFSFLGNTSGSEDFSQERIDQLLTKNESLLSKMANNPKLTKIFKELESLDIVESSNMGVLLNFEGYDQSNYESWPNTKMTFVNGSLKVLFRNGQTQDIRLEGILYRPFLFMNSTGFEPCNDPSEPPTLDFGLLHIDDERLQTIWLCNKSPVPAQWKIVYVPFPQKDYYGAATVTKLEKENQEKVDDPEVFEFEVTEGSNPGDNIGVNMVPSGNMFWDRKDFHGIYKELYPKKLKIMFKPKLNILYKCKYKIIVRGGPAIQFYLKGRGTYEECYKNNM